MSRNNLTVDDLTKSERKKYDEVVGLETSVAEQTAERNKLPAGPERDELDADIAKADGILGQLDAKLSALLDKHLVTVNNLANLKKGTEKLKAAKAAKKAAAGGPVDPPAPPAADPTPTPADPNPPAPPATPPAGDPPPPPADPAKKKKTNWAGWVIGGLLGAGALYLGISYNQGTFPFQRRKK